MTTADVILNYIHSQLTPEARAIGIDTNLTQEGYLDSTAMLDLILWIGEHFGVLIQNEDLTPENFATPRHVVEFIERHRTPTTGTQEPLDAALAGSMGTD